MVAALPANHALAEDTTKPLSLSALAAETFILYRRPSGPGLHDAILAGCHRAGFSPRVGQEAPRMLSTLNLVAAGLGVSIVPASMQGLHMDGVSFSALKDKPPLRAPLTFAHRRNERSPVVQRFITLVSQAIPKSRPRN